MSLKYKNFIKLVGKREFRKCLNNNLTHLDFHYKIGLNEDTVDSCKPCGLKILMNI